MERVKQFRPNCPEEKKEKDIVLEWIAQEPDILTRKCQRAHMSSSSMIFNPERTKLLMVFHNIYQSWSIPGGHTDGNSDLLAVAISEAKEETGILNLVLVSDEIEGLDIMPVNSHYKNGIYIPAHFHLNAMFCFEASEEEKLTVKENENSGVQWIAIDQLDEYCNEPAILLIYQRIIDRVLNQKGI